MYQKKVLGVNDVKEWLVRVCGYPSSVADTACDKVEKYLDTYQVMPPAKGAFLRHAQTKTGVDSLVAEIRRLDRKILATIAQRAARNPAYKALYDFEKFQMNQKGPVQKVTPDRVLESIETILENSAENLMTKLGTELIDKGVDLLRKQLVEENLRNSLHERDIRPQTAWSKMAHSRVRGLPWLRAGNKYIDTATGEEVSVDDAIIKLYGNDMNKIVDRVDQMKIIVGMPGLRFQGVPSPDPAKVRIIFMPEAPEQYALRAIQYPMQSLLKERSQLGSAWREPKAYWNTMKRVMAGQNSKYFYISLDYSKFDTRSSYYVRNKVIEVLMDVMIDDKISWKKKLIQTIQRLWINQYMMAPDSKLGVKLVQVANLLSSGDVVTQLLGNGENRVFQYAIATALGYELPRDLGNQLGDDTLLPVPKEIVIQLGGYDKLLVKLEKIIGLWGSKMNVKKQYPTMETAIFLQRAYNYPIGVIGEYSLIRALESLVWAENPRTAIEGVKNLDALEIIGQISVLNLITESQGIVTNKDLLLKIILPWWLGKDDALRGLVSDCNNKAGGDAGIAGAMLFSYLVAAVGGKQQVVSGLGLNAYDKYSVLPALRSENSLEETLPILSWICIAGKNMGRFSHDYRSIFETASEVNTSMIRDFYDA